MPEPPALQWGSTKLWRSPWQRIKDRAIDDRTARELLQIAEEAADARGADRDPAAARLRAAPTDVVAAVEWFLDADPAAAVRMTGVLSAFWQEVGLVDDGRRLTDRALERAPAGPTKAFVESLLAAAELAFRQGDQAAAERRSRQAIDAALEIGDSPTAAVAHTDLARIAYRDGNASLIEEHAELALELGGDDVRARRGALHMLAWAAHTAGDRALARRRFQESLAFRRQFGDRQQIAVEIANLADMALEDRDTKEAASSLAEVLGIARDLGSQYLILNMLPSIAVLAALIGDDESSAKLLGATEALSRSTGLLPDPGNWQAVLDRVGTRLGEGYKTAKQVGAELGTDAAIELALSVAAMSAPEAIRPAGH
jgi:tetratricopeptide (TPR) repeat protein